MPISKETKEKWMRYAIACEEDSRKLDEWQKGFIPSIKALLEEGTTLTLKQSQRLCKIYHKVVE